MSITQLVRGGVLGVSLQRSIPMIRSRLYRLVMLAATGGMLFQATAGCKSQALDTLTTSVVPALSSALTTAITAALQSGAAT
jgi:hypothetical protein